jgi:hypothetical protein
LFDYTTQDDPKKLRGTLAMAKLYITNYGPTEQKFEHIRVLERLMAECDRKGKK